MSLYDDLSQSGVTILRNALSEYPDTPVIVAHQSGKELNTSYATSYLMGIEQVGRTTKSTRLNNNGTEINYEVPTEVTFQYNFIGKDAASICYSSHMRLANSIINRENAQLENLSVVRKSAIRRIPQPRDTKYTEYLTYDVTFFFISGFTEVVGSIEQVIIEDTVNDVEISIPASLTP